MHEIIQRLPSLIANSAAIGALPIVDNVTMPVLETVFRPFALARGAMMKLALDLGRRFEVLPNRPDLPLSALSGGCKIGISLRADPKAPASTLSAAPAERAFSSADAALRAANPTVSEILVAY